MAGSFYTRSSIFSIVLHGLIIVLFLSWALVQGCLYRRKKVELIEFTVAVNTTDTEEETTLDKEEPPKEEPPKPREPDKPPALPPEPDRVPEVKKKPIQKGKRVVKGPKKPPVKQTLSDEEIAKWLRNRARIGEQTSLPNSEQARNFAIVRNELYAAWEQPVRSDAGVRPAEAEFSLDSRGSISAVRIIQSSGSPVFDQSVLAAIQRAGRIDGLSAAFLRAYPRLSVEFKLTDE